MPTPGVIEYPAALDTPLTLIEVANNGSSTLTGNISVSDLLIPVAQPAKFTNSGIATLTDSLTAPTKIEIFVYTSKSGSNLVVPVGGRGAQGTTAQAFNTGHFVEQRPTARHHTALADLLIAIEQKLGIGVDTPGAAIEALFSNGAGASVWRAIAAGDIAGAIGNLVRKDDAAAQTIISNLLLTKDVPFLILTDTVGVGGTGRMAVNEGTWNFDNGASLWLSVNLATLVATFSAIPLLPAVNPTLDDQAVRKGYVDGKQTFFSLPFRIDDPSTFPLNDFSALTLWLPPTGVTGLTLTRMKVVYAAGGHSAGGSVTFTLFVNGSSTGHSVSLNDTNNAAFVIYENNFGDITGVSSATFELTAKSGTILERAVTIVLEGFQKVT
jgi:hypothetical protein